MKRFVACVSIVVVVLIATQVTRMRDAVANGILVPPDNAATQHVDRHIALTRHDVQVRIHDQIAQVTVEHTFRSFSPVPLEGTYLFPLPPQAVVSAFAMTMGGKMVQGEVIEADKARAIYNAIVRERKDPGLLEYLGRGLFRARVFPIPARGEVRVRLTFQQVLEQDRGTLEFRYPLATHRLNGAPVRETIVDVQIDGTADIKGVYSPSHDFVVKRDGERKARLRIEQAHRPQRKDLLLYIGRSASAVGFSMLSHKGAGEDGTFMAMLAPRNVVKEHAKVPKDVVFVLDTSGSMEGQKLEQARAALAYGIRTLAADDRFNVVAFATGVVPFRDGLVPVTADTRKAAVEWIEARTAGGSTHISQALGDALRMQRPQRLSMVVLLTDGRPTVGIKDRKLLLDHVRSANTGHARVFTFGVGHDLDVEMLDRVAEETRGDRDYVAPNEDIEIVTDRFFEKVRQPVLSNVTVDLGPGVYDVYPSKLPDLFAGSQVVIYGRYRKAGDRTITLSGNLAGRQVTYEYATSFASGEGHDFLPRLWANRKVAFLVDQARLHGADKEVVDEIVKLATRHAIVTPYTAGLVVEDVDTGSPLAQMGGGIGPRWQRARPDPGLRDPRTTPAPPPAAGSPNPIPPTTPPPSPTPTQTSRDLKKRKTASAEIDDPALRAIRGRVSTVAGKTFTLRLDGRWIDTTWKPAQPTTKIEAFSEAYDALLAKDPKIARYLAIGEEVVFVWKGTAYEIVPAGTKRD